MSSYLLVANDILGKIFTLNGVDFGGKKKGATSFTVCQIVANGRIRSLATRSFYTGRFAAKYRNFMSFTTRMTGVRM